jgi:peptide/nickel transport system permease protein
VPLGLIAALFRDTFIDKFIRVIALVGHSIPVFWFGIVGLVIFYAGLNWAGGPGRVDVFYEGMVTPQTGLLLIDSLLQGETEIFWNALSHILLPASSWPMRRWPISPA